jgi:3-hydroxyacyl-CoA dehydrogenase
MSPSVLPPNKPGIRRVAVIGCGTIGASFATLFAANGLETSVYDPNPEAEKVLWEIIDQSHKALRQLQGAKSPEPKNLVTFTTSLAKALKGADLIQENTPEREEIKYTILAEIDDQASPTALICSSTSGLTCTSMQSALKKFPQRFLIAHPFNPPHLIPLIEIVGGERTSARSIQDAMEFYISIGKRPIHLKKEVVGHVANRLQSALAREVFYLLQQDIASVEDIDTALEYGPGVRWAAAGPSMLWHLAGGVGGAQHFSEHLLGPLLSWYAPSDPTVDDDLIKKWVDGTKSIVRDRKYGELCEARDRMVVKLLTLKEHDASL